MRLARVGAGIALALTLGQSANAETKKPHQSVDEAFGNCADSQIASGRFFVLKLNGELDVTHSSQRVIVACSAPANAWEADCERTSGNPQQCTGIQMQGTQALVLDGWLHRTNLQAWKNRT